LARKSAAARVISIRASPLVSTVTMALATISGAALCTESRRTAVLAP
jgi:hypothetical protein